MPVQLGKRKAILVQDRLSILTFSVRRSILRMNQPASSIAKQDVDLLRFEHCGDLAVAENGMHHRLALLIAPCPVIRVRSLALAGCNARFDTALEGAYRLARVAHGRSDLA